MNNHRNVCPECGLEQSLWESNEGTGYPIDEDMFCCQGCAETSSCTCETDDQLEAQAIDGNTEAEQKGEQNG